MSKGSNAKPDLSKSAQKASKNIAIRYNSDEEKYSKRVYAEVYRGYDFLQHLGTVRHYIQNHYDISWRDIELLLALFPLKAFTLNDFHTIPRSFSNNRFNTALDRGLIQILADHNTVVKRLFVLSTRSKHIVIRFYRMLSGEEKIPTDTKNNKMAKSDATKMDKYRLDYIERLNKLPVKEHFKKLF